MVLAGGFLKVISFILESLVQLIVEDEDEESEV